MIILGLEKEDDSAASTLRTEAEGTEDTAVVGMSLFCMNAPVDISLIRLIEGSSEIFLLSDSMLIFRFISFIPVSYLLLFVIIVLLCFLVSSLEFELDVFLIFPF